MVLHPTLSHCFQTYYRQLWYKRLLHNMLVSQEQICSSSFATCFVWVQLFPMHTKSQAHEPSSLLAQHVRVTLQMIIYGSKEQTLGKFCKKLQEMGCEIHQMELDSPWQNAAEGVIHSGRLILIMPRLHMGNSVGSHATLPSIWHPKLVGMKSIRQSHSRSVEDVPCICIQELVCKGIANMFTKSNPKCSYLFTRGGKRLVVGGIKDWLVQCIE